MELANRLLRVFVGHHLDEREATRATGRLIAHNTNVVHCSRAAEELRQLLVRGLIGKVTHVQSAAHRCEILSRAALSCGTTSARERRGHRWSARNCGPSGTHTGSETRNKRACDGRVYSRNVGKELDPCNKKVVPPANKCSPGDERSRVRARTR